LSRKGVTVRTKQNHLGWGGKKGRPKKELKKGLKKKEAQDRNPLKTKKLKKRWGVENKPFNKGARKKKGSAPKARKKRKAL